jgi:tetratricopeptide (TPR) repeat protein
MGKRFKERRGATSGQPEVSAAAPKSALPASSTASRFMGWRRAALRLAMAVVVPGVVLCVAELGLRLGGYGHSTRYFERAQDGLNVTTNPKFAWQFYSRETATTPTPLLFPVHKEPGTFRIFVLGESAAAGTPDPAFSFSRMLELMLRQQYPSNRFEVINAAMRGVNSHIIRHIARECAGLAPDLFLVYLGNNECIGLHSPSPREFNLAGHLWLLRLVDAVKASRLGQLARSTLRRLGPKSERKMQDMESLRRERLALDSPRRQAVYENFRANLNDICRTAARAGAKTILVTVAVNLRDFPPLASLHRPDLTPAHMVDFERAYSRGTAAESAGQTNEALVQFEAAVRLDDHFAELHFRLARGYEAAGQTNLARRHYTLARDWDALQFRADSRINEVLRDVAAEQGSRPEFSPAAVLADVAQGFSDSPLAAGGVPGRALFHDHVHFTFDGDYELARRILPSAAVAFGLPLAEEGWGGAGGRGTAPSRDECARALAYTPIEEMNVLAAMAQQTSKPPFLDQLEHAQRQSDADGQVRERLRRTTMQDFERAWSVYRAAIAQRPDDWMLHYNLGNLFSQFARHADAAAEYEWVVKRLPRQRVFRLNLGNALLQAGRPNEAIAQYRAALEIDPDFTPAREAIASAQTGAR